MTRAAASSNPIESIRGTQCLLATYLRPSGIRQRLLRPGMMDDSERSFGTLSLYLLDPSKVTADGLFEGAMIGMIHLWRTLQGSIDGVEPVNVWTIGASAANSGYGPVVYRVAMQLVCHGNNWVMCGDDVSASARRLWKRMYRDPDMEVVPSQRLVGGLADAKGKRRLTRSPQDAPELNAIYQYVGPDVPGSVAAFRRGEELIGREGPQALHWIEQHAAMYFFARSAGEQNATHS